MFYFMKLNCHQKDLLVGSLLGDANLQTETYGRTWRYRALQKAEHKEYLDHKYEIFKDMCNSPPTFSEVFDFASEAGKTRTQKTYERWFFNTTVQDCFRHYGNLFYTYDQKSGKMIKDVPKTIQKILSPRAIAYWYMDDGSLKWKGKSNAMRICTESFSTDGVNRLKKAFKDRYNIETQLTPKSKNGVFVGYRLAINEENSTPFRELIFPYLVDCMRYKVSDGNKGHL